MSGNESDDLQKFQVGLSNSQLNNLMKGAPFQMNHDQLTASGSGVHRVELHLGKKDFKRLLTNVKNKKGFRFNKNIVRGHGILSSAGRFAQKYIPKSLVKAGLAGAATAAGTFLGNPAAGAMAAPLIHKGVDAAYNYKFKEPKHHHSRYDDDDDEEDYEPPPPRRRAPPPRHRPVYDEEDDYEPPYRAAPPHSDYHGFHTGRGFLGENYNKDATDWLLKHPNTSWTDNPYNKKYLNKGSGILLKKKRGKLVKGSAEAKQWGREMRERRKGGNIFDDIKNTFSSSGPIAQAFQPGGSAEQAGKKIASVLIHQGIPATAGLIGSTLAEALMPEGGPVSGFVGNQIGQALGKQGADALGNATGYGLKEDYENRVRLNRARMGYKPGNAKEGDGIGDDIVGAYNNARQTLGVGVVEKLKDFIGAKQIDNARKLLHLAIRKKLGKGFLQDVQNTGNDALHSVGLGFLQDIQNTGNDALHSVGLGFLQDVQNTGNDALHSVGLGIDRKHKKLVQVIKGRGERLVDQKASIKEIVDFFKNELPSIFKYGDGERAIDQQFSVKDVVNFFKTELPDLFKSGGRLSRATTIARRVKRWKLNKERGGAVMKNADGSLSYSGSDDPIWARGHPFHSPNIPVEGGSFHRGVPQPIVSHLTNERIQSSGLLRHQRGSKNGLIHGGSFLPMG